MVKKIVMDVRMINMSGIGRYIQSLVPVVLEKFVNVSLLGNVDEIKKFSWAENVTIIDFNYPIYSIKEQAMFLVKVPRCYMFFSPHYNVPIFLPQAKKQCVIIPDVNHLVFKMELSLVKNLYAKLFYQIASRKDLVFTISEFSKNEIIKYTNCEPKDVIVAKCAIDKDYFQGLKEQLKYGTFSDSFTKYSEIDYILYVGNIKPHKNLKRSLLAFERLRSTNNNIKFIIVGKKDNFITKDNEIFSLVEDSEILKKDVEFTGKISDIELVYIYQNAKLLLFASLYEGFGLPPLEAMFLGCPVIVSREGSLPEICGDAALYCDAYDTNDISKKISELLNNLELRAKLISLGYLNAEHFDWNTFNSIIVDNLLRKISNNKNDKN